MPRISWPFGSHTAQHAPFPRYLRTPFIICLLFTTLSLLLSFIALTSYQPVIPLWYSLARPSEQLAGKEWLFVLPGISAGITFLHWLVIQQTRLYNTLLLKLFAWVTVLLLLILLLALIRILVVVG
jgi:hypothetical protein